MQKSKKMIALVIALVVALAVISSALIVVLVIGNQSATSTVKVVYTSSDVHVKVEAKYYIGKTGTDLTNGSATYIELSPTTTTGSLNQDASEVVLSKDNPKIVYEYKFTNLSSTITAIVSQTKDSNNIAVVPVDAYNNVTLTYNSAIDQIGAGYDAGATATTFSDCVVPVNEVKYVYVIVSINDLLYDVDFEGNFGWTLSKGTTVQSVGTSSNSIVQVNLADTNLYNATQVQNIDLFLDQVNNEPTIFPVIEGKSFLGWYSNSALTTPVTWPCTITSSTRLYPKYATTSDGFTLRYLKKRDVYYIKSYEGTATTVYLPDIANDGTNGVKKVAGIDQGALSVDAEVVDIENITFGKNITRILSNIFEGNTKLTSLTVSSNLAYLYEGAFKGCINLTSITVDSNNVMYDSRNNCNAVIETESNTLVAGCKNTIIPDSVKIIGDYAFQGMGLTAINLPEGIEEIGIYSFIGNSLQTINFPASLKKLNQVAFNQNPNLTSATFADPYNWYNEIDKSINNFTDPANNATILSTYKFEMLITYYIKQN